jgi:hypothetical protein
MEEEKDTSTEIVVVEESTNVVKRGPYKKTRKANTFLKPKGHDLDKAIKQSGRYLQTALETLVHISVDKNAADKDRRMAAEAILTLHTKMVDQRDKDEIIRLEKEVVLLKLVGAGTTTPEDDEEEDEDDTPAVDFLNVHEDFRDQPVIDVQMTEQILDKEED